MVVDNKRWKVTVIKILDELYDTICRGKIKQKKMLNKF